MDFFATYFTHVQTYMITFVLTASVHTLQRSKPATTCVFEVLRNGLLRYILYTCPNSKPIWQRSCWLPCAPCLFLFQNHKFHIRHKRMPKLLKTQMLAMCIFYFKLHMKVMTTENVMLHLHGKNQAKWVFSKNQCVFTILINLFKKKEQQRNHY